MRTAYFRRRSHPWDPRHAGRAAQRAVFADRRVRRSVPHAPVDPRRLCLPPRHRRCADRGPEFRQVTDVKGNQLLAATSTADLLYSFGTLYPGALQLHNGLAAPEERSPPLPHPALRAQSRTTSSPPGLAPAPSAACRGRGSARSLPAARRGPRRSRRAAWWSYRCSRPRTRSCRRSAASRTARAG